MFKNEGFPKNTNEVKDSGLESKKDVLLKKLRKLAIPATVYATVLASCFSPNQNEAGTKEADILNKDKEIELVTEKLNKLEESGTLDTLNVSLEDIYNKYQTEALSSFGLSANDSLEKFIDVYKNLTNSQLESVDGGHLLATLDDMIDKEIDRIGFDSTLTQEESMEKYRQLMEFVPTDRGGAPSISYARLSNILRLKY